MNGQEKVEVDILKIMEQLGIRSDSFDNLHLEVMAAPSGSVNPDSTS